MLLLNLIVSGQPLLGKRFPSVSENQRLDMLKHPGRRPVRMVLPDPHAKANARQVVFAREPVLFCLEKEDVSFPVEKARVDIKPEDVATQVEVKFHPELMDGINQFHVPGVVDEKPVKLKLAPWSVRANRSQDSRWVIFLPLVRSVK